MNIRNILGNIYSFFLWHLFSYLYVKKNTSKGFLLSIYFHNPSKKVFNTCYKWLIKNNFNIISVQDFEQFIAKGYKLPNKSAILSLDDGWKGNIENVFELQKTAEFPIILFTPTLPIIDGNLWLRLFRKNESDLITKGIVKSIKEIKKIDEPSRKYLYKQYLSTSNIERSIMTFQDLISILNKNLSIGGHTHSHPVLTNCTNKEIVKEIELSNKLLSENINTEIIYFAYPNGTYNENIKDIIKKYYNLAFTIEQKWVDLKDIDPFAVPRICVPDGFLKYETLCRMTGLWEKSINIFKLKW